MMVLSEMQLKVKELIDESRVDTEKEYLHTKKTIETALLNYIFDYHAYMQINDIVISTLSKIAAEQNLYNKSIEELCELCEQNTKTLYGSFEKSVKMLPRLKVGLFTSKANRALREVEHNQATGCLISTLSADFEAIVLELTKNVVTQNNLLKDQISSIVSQVSEQMQHISLAAASKISARERYLDELMSAPFVYKLHPTKRAHDEYMSAARVSTKWAKDSGELSGHIAENLYYYLTHESCLWDIVLPDTYPEFVLSWAEEYIGIICMKKYDRGYIDGENVGYSNGYSNGYSDGYSEGESVGYSAGESAGYSSGYSAGENAGYSNGYSAGDQNND